MEEELLEGSSSSSYTEIFHEAFPQYLAMGMTVAEFWEGSSYLVKHYREAYMLKQEAFNRNAWLQNLYTYEAVSKAIYNNFNGAFGRKGKAQEYIKEPIEFENKKKKLTQEELEVRETEKLEKYFDRLEKQLLKQNTPM